MTTSSRDARSTHLPDLMVLSSGLKPIASGSRAVRDPIPKRVGALSKVHHFHLDPSGFRSLLNYLYKVYHFALVLGLGAQNLTSPTHPQRYKLPIFVTENGFAVKDEDSKPLEEALNDTDRINYFRGATESLLRAVNDDGVDIRAYFPWSKSRFIHRHA